MELIPPVHKWQALKSKPLKSPKTEQLTWWIWLRRLVLFFWSSIALLRSVESLQLCRYYACCCIMTLPEFKLHLTLGAQRWPDSEILALTFSLCGLCESPPYTDMQQGVCDNRGYICNNFSVLLYFMFIFTMCVCACYWKWVWMKIESGWPVSSVRTKKWKLRPLYCSVESFP